VSVAVGERRARRVPVRSGNSGQSRLLAAGGLRRRAAQILLGVSLSCLIGMLGSLALAAIVILAVCLAK
jgi:hypothetical protein